MLARKRIEIGAGDLLAGMAACLRPGRPGERRERERRERVRRDLEHRWAGEQGFACLSVRSALDLYLTARAFPAGCEVLMTGANIPDMARVVAAHGLVPVAVDFDLADLAPPAEAVAAWRTGRSRCLLVAQLFGATVPLAPYAELCRRHGLDLVEDCAQAFRGPDHRGDPAALLSLFSFGPIKSATALGGALATVRDPALLAAMRDAEARWPAAGDALHLKRLLRYAGLAALTHPWPYGMLAAAARRFGDLDRWVAGAAHSFPGGELMRQLRRRPPPALLALLHRRLRRADADTYRRRGEAGRGLARNCRGVGEVPGADHEPHSFWVFPLLADDPDRLVRALRTAGFDATRHATLAPVGPDLPRLRAAFDRLVYLPFDPLRSPRRMRRLAKAVGRLGRIDPGTVVV